MLHRAGIGLLFLLVGCADAPRDNPLDPLSPGYVSPEGSLTGTVLVKNQGTPVSSARVQIPSSGIFVLSDSSGKFTFPRLSPGQITVVCTKDNFSPDSQRVTLSGGPTSVTFSLNGAPVVLSQTILTRKIDQYYPSPQYYVDVSADLSDPNGITDLDSVYFCAGSLWFPMTYVPSSRMFETRVFKYDLPTNTIQWLVGKPLTIVSMDRLRAVNTGEPFYVLRVIETPPTPVSPSSVHNDTTDGTPLFTWQAPVVSFTYTNTVTVSRVDQGTQTVVWEAAGLTPLSETYQYPQTGTPPPLTTGNYVWAVTLVDEFGNSCRSKESSFAVR
jgi:hypothetical protein